MIKKEKHFKKGSWFWYGKCEKSKKESRTISVFLMVQWFYQTKSIKSQYSWWRSFWLWKWFYQRYWGATRKQEKDEELLQGDFMEESETTENEHAAINPVRSFIKDK